MSILNSSRLCNRIEFQVYSFFSTYSQPFCPESSVLLVSVILIIPFFFSLAVEVFLYFTYKSDYIYCSCWRAGFFPFQQVDPYEVNIYSLETDIKRCRKSNDLFGKTYINPYFLNKLLFKNSKFIHHIHNFIHLSGFHDVILSPFKS